MNAAYIDLITLKITAMIDLSKLDSKLVWENFKQICAIPHPSKHEGKITAFLMKWAKEHNIDARQDAIGNIIMRKPATPGMENRKMAILQGHIDMVPQKNSDKNATRFPSDLSTFQPKCLKPTQ